MLGNAMLYVDLVILQIKRFQQMLEGGAASETTNLISTRCDAQSQIPFFHHLLPFLFKVKVLAHTPTAEEEEVLCERRQGISFGVAKAKGKRSPLAPTRCRSSISARKGATPVPGPTMISGGVPAGSRRMPEVSKRTGRRSSGSKVASVEFEAIKEGNNSYQVTMKRCRKCRPPCEVLT